MIKKNLTPHVMVVLIIVFFAGIAHAFDPLPSWNDTKSKQAIMQFVQKVTKEGASTFVPVEERIATFDNDGTLWAEQPMYFQLFYSLDRIAALAPQHPEWKTKEPFASLLRGDIKTVAQGGAKNMIDIVMATHSGMTNEAFEQSVKEWIATAKHPQTG